MTRRKVFAALVAVGATAIVAAVTGFTSNQNAFSGTIYFGMDAPLTGPTELVGQSDRQTVQAVVAYWNARGGIKGRRVVVDVLDNASNPSQAVQNIQKFTGDSKYVGDPRLGQRGRGRGDGADRQPGGHPLHRALAADDARRAAHPVRLRREPDGAAVRVQRGRVSPQAEDLEASG